MAGQYRVADFIADYLSEIGINTIFLLPGGGCMHLVDAVGKHEELTVIGCHHEQAVGVAAEACGRVQGNFGVAIVTNGPGSTNIVTPVAGAWIDSVPLLVVSGQVKRSDLMKDSGLRQKGVQEVNIVGMVEGITKYAKTLEEPLDVKYELQKAIHLATTGRNGPVWLDVPLDVQGFPIQDPASLRSFEPPAVNDSPTAEDIQAVVKLLSGAKRPLLLIGHGVHLGHGEDDFMKLVEKLQIPFVTTWTAMDILPYDHELNVGRPGVVALRAPNFAVQNCDLFLSVGSRVDNIMTAFNPRGFARSAKKVIVDIDPNEIRKQDMEIERAIVCDAAKFLKALVEAVRGPLDIPDWRTKCRGWKERYSVNDGKPFEPKAGLDHYELSDSLSRLLPENTIISTGCSGLAIEIFYTIFRNKKGQRLILTAGLGPMGFGLPGAIGACVGNRKAPIVAIESDGSLQLNIQEFATIRAHNLPICLIVLNNGGYTSIRNTQRNYFEGRLVATGPEAELWLPDLEKIANTYELAYHRVDNREDLDTELTKAIASRKACIFDVILHPDEILKYKVTAMPQADGTMVSMPLEDLSPLLELQVLKEEMLIELSDISVNVRNK